MLNTIRKALAGVDRNPVLAHPSSLDNYLADHDYLKPRFRLISFSICAALGLGLSMIGLFGVMAYSVALQTHESGVRMALGARRSNILGLVLRQGLLLVGSGVAVGLAAAFIAARALQSQLWGVSAFDPGRLCARPSGPAAHRPAGVLLASPPCHPRGSHNCPALRLSHADGQAESEKGPEETRG
jgi:hypothetical protein